MAEISDQDSDRFASQQHDSIYLPESNANQRQVRTRKTAMRAFLTHPWFHPCLLLLLTALGLVLRLLNLTQKAPWTDEFATLVFSLGNSFLTVPLDQVITADQLLQPLQPDPNAGLQSVVYHLLNESNHPPLYFMLTHLWLKLFPASDGLVSVWGARSLSVLFGTLAIPATFWLGKFAFKSRLVGHLSAALMAVSPFGIYLAQEARHYTLPLLWLIASLGCLIAASRSIRRRAPLPLKLCVTWVLVNLLGIATHYLFILALLVEGGVLLTMGLIQSWQEQGRWYPSAHWWRIVAVAAATTMGGLMWLPFLQDVQDSKLTQWIQQTNRDGLEWLDPVIQMIAGWISMLYLLPIQAPSEPVVVISGAILIVLTLWTVPKLYGGIRLQMKQREKRLPVLVLGTYVTIAILLFWGITYVLGRDVTSAFRYNFVYFPAVIVLVGAALASVWQGDIQTLLNPDGPRWQQFLQTGKPRTVVAIGLISLLGGLTVVTNLAYQKTHRPDVVAADIRTEARENPATQGNILVAIPHETHGQTGRLMGIAWALQHSHTPEVSNPNPRYLLAHLGQNPRTIVRVLKRALDQSPDPTDLWLLNSREVPDEPLETLLEQQRCSTVTKSKSVDGYRYRLYRCRGSKG